MTCCKKEMIGACWKEDRILRCTICERYVEKESSKLIKKILKQEEKIKE